MKLLRDGKNTITVETDADETLYFAPRFLRTRAIRLSFPPPFWRQCLIGRLLNDCYFLQQSTGGPESATTTLSGLTPTGSFEMFTLKAGEKAFVSLEHLAGFVVTDKSQTWPGKPVMHPILKALCSPTMWIMGHPIPCVFEGPVTLMFNGAALRWDDSTAPKEYQVAQVIAFDATRRFGILAMNPGPNPMSLLYNALTFQSRFVAEEGRVLIEDYIAPPRLNLRILRHFIAHVGLVILIFIIFWLNR